MLKSQNTNRLAIEGGVPVRAAPLPPWPHFSQDEIRAVADVLESGRVNYWTGQAIQQFEKEFSNYVGTSHAIALSNGTVALELALKVLDIGTGDEVLVTSRSFIASAACAVVCGATPVFADVDSLSQNVTADTLRPLITKKTKAIIVVHLAGWPCEMDEILELAEAYGIDVIEDCAQAIGATYKSRAVGSMGRINAFSFCQDKIITSGGEGGMLTTNDSELWERAWSYKDHGKNYYLAHDKPQNSAFRWLHESIGTNWRMTEMQAAIGRKQLKKLESWVGLRRRNADMLSDCFSQIAALRVSAPPKHIEHAYYKYYAFVRPELLDSAWSRDRIIAAINAEGIACMSGSCPEIYMEDAFLSQELRRKERWQVAKALGETSLMFLVHPTLEESDLQDVCRAVEKVFRTVEKS